LSLEAMTREEDGALEISRLLPVSRAQLWRARCDHLLLAQWRCPKPWTSEVLAFDLRPGGAFHTLMRGPDFEESDNPGCFLEILPHAKIVWTTTMTAGWRPASPWLAITAVFTMTDEGQGTRYVARCLHKDAEDCKKHADMGFFEGWGVCITQPQALAETLAN